MQVSKNFVLQEFVSPDAFKLFGKNAIWFTDPKVIATAQWLRDYIGKAVTINNWHEGGHYTESGLRSFLTNTGAQYSQHKYGRAADCKVEGMNGDELRHIVEVNKKALIKIGLTTIELGTPTWLHFDVRFTGLDDILKVPFK